jgi:type IV secretory pathway VirD2 relaxase
MRAEGRGWQSTKDHENYVEREGVDRNGDHRAALSGVTYHADGDAFAERRAENCHRFRFIVSSEEVAQIAELKVLHPYDHGRDFGTRLDRVALDHWDTDNHARISGFEVKTRTAAS